MPQVTPISPTLLAIPELVTLTETAKKWLWTLGQKLGAVARRAYISTKRELQLLKNTLLGSFIHYMWLASHLFTLLGFGFYLYHYFDPYAATAYYTAALGTASTYAVVTYRHITLLRTSLKQNKLQANPFSLILKSENTHLLGMALLLVISPPSLIKVASFAIYSYLNVASYFLCDVFPDNALTNAVLPLFNYFENSLLVGAATIDILAFLVYLKDALFNQQPYAIIIYLMIFGLRLENSQICKDALHNCFASLLHILEGIPGIQSFLDALSDLEVFFLERPQTQGPKIDRIASLVFDSLNVVNDLY